MIKEKADYTARLLTSEEGRREANTRLSIAEGEKARAERDLAEAEAEAKKGLKKHDHHYLKINQVLEIG